MYTKTEKQYPINSLDILLTQKLKMCKHEPPSEKVGKWEKGYNVVFRQSLNKIIIAGYRKWFDLQSNNKFWEVKVLIRLENKK